MKIVKIIFLILALIFVAIQFIPSGIPGNEPDGEMSIASSGLVPGPVLQQLSLSCFDCHSNHINLPWYSKVAPVSWLLAGHIKEGREHLNFSVWEDYSRREKIGLLNDIGEEVKSGTMPLKSYLLMHGDAELDSSDVETLVSWAEEASARILE